MKNVIILCDHAHVRYDQIAEPGLRQHVITSEAGAAQVRPSDLASLDGLYVDRDFSLASLIKIVDQRVPNVAEFVTNNESLVSACGKLRQHFGISDDDYLRFCDKDVMKKRLGGGGLRFPRYRVFDKRHYRAEGTPYLDQLIEELGLPVFVKPLNGAGSVGTGRIETQVALERWAIEALEAPHEFEVDQFIEGTLFHCETLLKDGQVLFTQACEYSRPCFDFTLGKPIGSITLPDDHPDSFLLKAFALEVHRQLAGRISGVTHLEVFKDCRGELFFVEIAYRTPGVLASEMYQCRLGLSLPECHIRLQVSDGYRVNFQERAFAARFIYPRDAGVVSGFSWVNITSEHEFQWRIGVGQTLSRSSRISEMAGTMLLWNRDFDRLHADFRALADVIPYSVRPERGAQ